MMVMLIAVYIRSGSIGGATGDPNVYSVWANACSSGANYSIGNSWSNAYVCTPFIRIGSQVGEVQ